MRALKNLLLQWFVNQFRGSGKPTPWWLEIETQMPQCTYYFGPFNSITEAQRYQPGYIEDLLDEKAQGISWKLTQTQPTLLTIY